MEIVNFRDPEEQTFIFMQNVNLFTSQFLLCVNKRYLLSKLDLICPYEEDREF